MVSNGDIKLKIHIMNFADIRENRWRGSLSRCGRDSSRNFNFHLMSILTFSCGGFCGRFLYLCINSAINEI